MKNETKVCRDCGTIDKSKKIVKGHIILEIFLWLVFFPIGLIYTAWRVSTSYKGCSNCDSKNVIDANSPLGKKLVKELEDGGF